jgi:hypothetical protein
LDANLLDFSGVTFAAAEAPRLPFFALDVAAFGDFLAELDATATAGDGRFVAGIGDLDTPPLTADLGVLAGDAVAAAADLAVNLFPGLGDFAGAFPLLVESVFFRKTISCKTMQSRHCHANGGMDFQNKTRYSLRATSAMAWMRRARGVLWFGESFREGIMFAVNGNSGILSLAPADEQCSNKNLNQDRN